MNAVLSDLPIIIFICFCLCLAFYSFSFIIPMCDSPPPLPVTLLAPAWPIRGWREECYGKNSLCQVGVRDISIRNKSYTVHYYISVGSVLCCWLESLVQIQGLPERLLICILALFQSLAVCSKGDCKTIKWKCNSWRNDAVIVLGKPFSWRVAVHNKIHF